MAIELCSKSQKCVNAAYKKVKIGTKATIEFPHSIPGIETLKFLKSKKWSQNIFRILLKKSTCSLFL